MALDALERVKVIEPSSLAWEANALPLSYTRRIKRGFPKSQLVAVTSPRALFTIVLSVYTEVAASARHVVYIGNGFWTIMSSLVREQQKLLCFILLWIISTLKRPITVLAGAL